MKRNSYPCRIAATGRTKEELIANLEKKLEPRHSHDSTQIAKLIFVFCGMGTSWKEMGQEFLEIQVFRDKISEMDAELKAYVPWSLKQRLAEGHDVADPVYGPIATFAYQVAQFATWKRWGLQPQAIVGQSVGEVAAACCAGMLSSKEAVKLIYFRTTAIASPIKEAEALAYSRTTAIASTRQSGRMMAVTNCDVQDVRSLCKEKNGQICVALEYSPTACAVSGDQEAVEQIQGKLRERFPESSCNILPVGCAYHSHHMTSCREKFLQELKSLDATAPTEGVEIASTVRGDLAKDDDFMSPDYWARSIQDPNLFFQGLKVLLDPSKLNLIVEIGPKPILRAHLKEYEKLECDILRFSSSMERDEIQCMMQSLTELFEHGLTPHWHEVMLFPTSTLTDHPMYHFDRKKLFVLPSRGRKECFGIMCKPGDHRLLRKITGGPDNKLKMVLESGSMDSVFQHRVHGVIILPGAVYLELGLAAAWLKDVTSLYRTTVNMKFLEPVKLDPKVNLELDVVMTPCESTEESRFRIEVLKGKVTHAIGEIEIDKHQGQAQKFDLSALMKRCTTKLSSEENKKMLKDNGFKYGPDWWMQGETRHNDEEAVVELQPGECTKKEAHGFLVHPAILDASFQAALPLSKSGSLQNLIPTGVEGCRLFRPIQECRYAYARKAVQDDNQVSFSLLLLSESGDVVLEVTNFRVQAIGQAGTSQVLTNLVWRKVPDCKPPERPHQDPKNVVMIGDFLEVRKEANVFSLNPHVDEHRQLDSAIEFCKNDPNISAIYFYVPQATDTKFEVKVLQTKAQATCITLKNILLRLASKRVELPLVVVTRFAWPSPEKDTNHLETGSGICSAPLWGLVRTALRESGNHSRVRLVDLQTEEGDIDGLSILSAVLENSCFVDFPEIMLTDKSVYVQEIQNVDGNYPLFRSHVFDASCKAVAYFDDLSHTNIHLRYDTSAQSSAEQERKTMLIQTDTAAHFTSGFFGQPSFGETSKISFDSEVLATEFKGRLLSAPNEEVVCIVPHAVTTHLEVSESRTLPLRLIPHYRPGFAMKLTLLQWMKQSARGKRHILIAANEESESFARLLKDMLCSVPETRTLEILLVNKEQTKDLENQSFDCVISMVKFTEELAQDLIRLGIQPKILIAVETLITERAVLTLISHIPDLQIVSATPSSLYTQSLSGMKEWMERKKAVLERVCDSWAASDQEYSRTSTCSRDVSALFTVETFLSTGRNASSLPLRACDPTLFRPDAAYIVVGGLTGLGWECVKFLATHGAGIIVIFNRRPASSERNKEMKELEERYTCHVRSEQVDVTDKHASAAVLEGLRKEVGIIKGIFFGAAVVHDEILEKMTEENLQKVMAPKIVGAWNLHELTKDLQLDYFVLHSSVSSTLGNPGQGSYSAGNCFLDALALHRRSQGLSGQSINWGPLTIGILEGNDKVAKDLETAGMPQLNVEEIHTWLRIVLLRDDPQIMVCKLELEKFYYMKYTVGRHLVTRMRPLFESRHFDNATVETSDRVKVNVQELTSLDRAQRHQKLTLYTKDVLHHVISVTESQLKEDSALSELGMDSVKGMTLSSAILDDVGVKVEIMELLQGEMTLRDLVDMLDRTMFSQDSDGNSAEKANENTWHSY